MSELELINKFLRYFNEGSYKREVYANSYIADIVFEDKEIAIEAKLNDINKALVQACAYKITYKNTFILVPYKKKKTLMSKKEILRRNGIKWIFLKNDGTISFGHSAWKKILFN